MQTLVIARQTGEGAEVERWLAQAGWRVIKTPSCVQGRKILESNAEIELALLGQVKREHRHVPVILVTGRSGEYTPARAMALGADGYFARPFHIRKLAFTLRQALDARSRRKPTPV